MAWHEINLAEVERRRGRLFNRFGEAPVVERHNAPEPADFEDWIELSKSGYIGSAYALIERSPDDLSPLSESMAVENTEQKRVLLILGRGSSEWGVPGGGQEGNETMEAAVQREVMEEVGISASLTGVNHLRHETATCEGYDERLHVLRVFFHAKYEGGSITIQPGELNGAAWFSNPPTETRLLPSTQRLLENWNPH
jgi:8-oxo-dGTP pyrophosphatase MutT (NUDIX family)